MLRSLGRRVLYRDTIPGNELKSVETGFPTCTSGSLTRKEARLQDVTGKGNGYEVLLDPSTFRWELCPSSADGGSI